MKDPTKIGTVLRGKVYTVPSYTNLYGKKVDGNNTTIKLYTPSLTVDNHGVEPITLLRVIIEHYADQGSLNSEESKAIKDIARAYRTLKLNI